MRLLAAIGLLAVPSACSEPVQTAGACPGPRAGWITPDDRSMFEAFVINRVSIRPGNGLKWNGVAIDRQTLRKYLIASRSMEPPPLIILKPAEGGDCAFLQAVRDDMESVYPCSLGSCGEGQGGWVFDVQEQDRSNASAEPAAPAVR
jgi:hypothetical protein